MAILVMSFLAAAILALTVSADDQCGLYLAPSPGSTLADTTWSLYAGTAIAEGQPISFPNYAVAVHNLVEHNYEDYDDDEFEFLQALTQYMLANMWGVDVIGAADELESGTAHAMLGGAGLLARYSSAKGNADFDVLSGFQRTNELVGEANSGRSHPGRGAITPFDHVILRSLRDITPGQEIFLNYEVFENGEEPVEEVEIDQQDIVRIDQTIDQMLSFFGKHEKNLDAESKQQIYNFLTEDFMDAAVGSQKARKVAELLPASPDDLIKVKQAGGVANFNATVSPGQKAIKWLDQNGFCLDNIRPGPSKIENAGRGAFATRAMSKDAVIAPVPLFHIPDKVVLTMWPLGYDEEEDRLVRAADDPMAQSQLLTNYVFSHPESTMAFFPASPTVGLINHADGPNAKLRWSEHPGHRKDWFELTPPEFLETEDIKAVKLVMELVALRGISEGEEIVIDYGEEWKKAWQAHVKQWDMEDGTWPVQAAELNAQHQTTFFKTEEEQEDEPYPEAVVIKAFVLLSDDDLSEGTEDDPHTWTEPASWTLYTLNELVDAQIVDREELDNSDSPTPYTYTIMFELPEEGGVVFATEVPHKALVFVDSPEMGDQFTNGAFRHYIGIPDDVFPKGAWRNLA